MLSFFGWGSSPKYDSSPANSNTQESSSSSKQTSTEPSPPSSSSASSSTPPQSQTQPPSPQLAQQQSPPRINTNLKLLFGGMAFFACSLLITRRSFVKKRLASIPPFYTGSVYHQPRVNGAMEAFEALNLATVNVLSFGMMGAGAVLYAFDINGLEDMRRIVRGGLNGEGSGKTDEELEREVTEWVVSVLGDRFEKQLEKEKLKKLQEEGKTDDSGKGK